MRTKLIIVIFCLLSLMATNDSHAQVSLSSLEKITTASTIQIHTILQGFYYNTIAAMWAKKGEEEGEIVRIGVLGHPNTIQYIFTAPNYYKKLLAEVKKSTNNNVIKEITTPSDDEAEEHDIFYENKAYVYMFRILSQYGKVYGYNIIVAKK